MLTFEITKTNTPLPQKGLTPILIAPPHTHVQQRLVLWNKAKPMLLTYREESKQLRHPIAGLPTPWVLSSAAKLIWYLHGSYFLPYCNTAQPNTIELSIISDAVYTGSHAATRQIPDSKLLLRSIYDILTQISNDFQRSLCRQTATGPKSLSRPVWTQCKPSFVPQTFSSFVFLSAISIFLSLLASANVRHVHCWALSPLIMSRHAPYCWLATSLFWYSAPTRFLKRFWKNTYPTFK